MRTIAIGDVHGCSRALDALLDELQPARHDTVVMLGDYVDRGPDSRGVIDALIQLDGHCQLKPLLGNHELMLLGVVSRGLAPELWMQSGGHATVASYGGAIDKIPAAHLQFIERCLPHYENERSGFIHAGYVAGVDLADQPEQVRFWNHLNAPIPPPHHSGKTIFVGHTPQRTGAILNCGHLLCLDTFCCGGGYLTAMDVDSRQLWQADRHGILRRPSLLHRSPLSGVARWLFRRQGGN